ncbi:MAG: restriction endonuclease subunit S, partial [Spirochaetales bacterium]|nr:restriction endonuclease subunit S [Spirochaetales bacterium]
MVYCNKKLLKNISTIHSGYALRGKIPENTHGSMAILQMKDVQPEGIDWDGLTLMNPIGKRTPIFLQKGDVIFSGRGTKIFAQAVTIQPDKVAAGPQYFVICPNKDVPAEYLAWYINSSAGQKYFWTNAGGTSIINVTREVLENLPIRIPSKRDMDTFVKYIIAIAKENKKFSTIQIKRQKLLESIIS